MGRRHRLKIPSAMDWHWVWFLYLLWAWISSYIKWKYKSICTAKNNKIKWELLKCWPYLYTTQLVRPKLRWRDMSIDMSILSHQIVCVCVLVTQSCPTLYNSMGNARHGISQTRTLEWGAIPSSRGSSQPRDWSQVSHTGGRFLTIWATRYSKTKPNLLVKKQKEKELKGLSLN